MKINHFQLYIFFLYGVGGFEIWRFWVPPVWNEWNPVWNESAKGYFFEIWSNNDKTRRIITSFGPTATWLSPSSRLWWRCRKTFFLSQLNIILNCVFFPLLKKAFWNLSLPPILIMSMHLAISVHCKQWWSNDPSVPLLRGSSRASALPSPARPSPAQPGPTRRGGGGPQPGLARWGRASPGSARQARWQMGARSAQFNVLVGAKRGRINLATLFPQWFFTGSLNRMNESEEIAAHSLCLRCLDGARAPPN